LRATTIVRLSSGSPKVWIALRSTSSAAEERGSRLPSSPLSESKVHRRQQHAGDPGGDDQEAQPDDRPRQPLPEAAPRRGWTRFSIRHAAPLPSRGGSQTSTAALSSV
jgi:hypothetical protein